MDFEFASSNETYEACIEDHIGRYRKFDMMHIMPNQIDFQPTLTKEVRKHSHGYLRVPAPNLPPGLPGAFLWVAMRVLAYEAIVKII